jgi:hypothetical protein
MMRQLLVECSDPGLVISLTEELENVLRNLDFDRARALQSQLGHLASELGPEIEAAWHGFRLEQPNDGGWPPSFGNREGMKQDEKPLKALLHGAAERNLGSFELRWTMLLPQGGPNPETRDQYISDLADGIRYDGWEALGISRMPTDLPDAMVAHRERLMDEHASGALRGRARFPDVGHRWVRDSIEQLRKVLEEVDTRAEAVMEYELRRLGPSEIEPAERVRWAALAVRLGFEFEKWCAAAEEPLAYLHQRAALLWHLWNACHGWGRARPFLEGRFKAVIEQAGAVYTPDGVAALQHVYDELYQDRWDRLLHPVPDEEPGEDSDDDLVQ